MEVLTFVEHCLSASLTNNALQTQKSTRLPQMKRSQTKVLADKKFSLLARFADKQRESQILGSETMPKELIQKC